MSTAPSILVFDVRSPSFVRQMRLIGMTLLLASVLYLLAANWFWLPHALRLTIPMLLLVISASVSICSSISENLRSALHTVAGMMMGLTLAVIGQTYQTGADSFWLFVLWALLLIPWLYRKNLPLFALFLVVSELGVCLFFKQNFYGLSSAGHLLAQNALLYLLLFVSWRYYPAMRHALTMAIGALAIYGGHLLVDADMLSTPTLVMAVVSLFVLPILTSLFFWRQRDQICLALMLSAFSGGLLYWLLRQIDYTGAGEVFLAGLLVLLWAGIIGYWLLRLFPLGKFHALPLGLGAWLAGLIFAALFLVFWQDVSMFFGLIAFLLALIGLYHIQHPKNPHLSNALLRHLLYCLMLVGQVAFMAHLFIRLEHAEGIMLLLQMVVVAALLAVRLHWLVIAIQAYALFIIAWLYFMTGQDITFMHSNSTLATLEVLALSPWLLLSSPRLRTYARAIFILGLLVMLTSIGLRHSAWLALKDLRPLGIWQVHAPDIVMFVWIGAIAWRFFIGHMGGVQLMALMLMAVILIGLGYFELFVLLLGLAWASTHKDRFIWTLYFLGLGLMLCYIYYSLSLGLLIKSATIFISGLLFMALAWLLAQDAKQPKGDSK